jgi:hypothetical protein
MKSVFVNVRRADKTSGVQKRSDQFAAYSARSTRNKNSFTI